MLQSLREAGHEIAFVTLHVGVGTFLPVRDNDVSKHVMHAEPYEISEETAQRIRAARSEGRCVVAVGTTVVRTLESAVGAAGVLQAGTGESQLFIRPGFRFQVIDALVTNFHLPRSTLLMLVCALGGQAGVLAAYEEAVRAQYRFFSYGDAMLICRA